MMILKDASKLKLFVKLSVKLLISTNSSHYLTFDTNCAQQACCCCTRNTQVHAYL